MCKRTQNLHNSRKSVPLYRVFHSIRFKVNKRLEFSGTPFFMSLSEQKNSGPENKSFQARNFYFMLLSFTSVQS